MTKAYNEAEFSEQISSDRNWRIREISDLKTVIKRSDKSLQRVLLRALVAICYAHWEGAVRFAARKYLEHVSLKRISYGKLERQFVRNYFLPRLSALSGSKVSVKERCLLIDDILNSSEEKFVKINDDLINTKSNLNMDVLKDICLVCGVNSEEFEGHQSFIDVVLLKRRNAVAHGEEVLIEIDDLDKISDETIGLMRMFGDALENHVVLGTYRAA